MEDEERRQLAGNPDWMSSLPEELLDVPLWNLAIPGKTEIPSRVNMACFLFLFHPACVSSVCTLMLHGQMYMDLGAFLSPQGATTACLSAWMSPLPS